MGRRGENAVRATKDTNYDPRWSSLDPDECAGKVKLMTHLAYGERFFLNEDVANRESRGWKVIEYVDPTKMVARSPGRPRKE